MQTLQSTALGAAAVASGCWKRNGAQSRLQAHDVGRKLLFRDGLPLKARGSAAIFLSPVNGCRLDGRTDGILLVVGSDLAADKM